MFEIQSSALGEWNEKCLAHQRFVLVNNLCLSSFMLSPSCTVQHNVYLFIRV